MGEFKIKKSITFRDGSSLEKYLQEISKLALISHEEEIDLFKQIRGGSIEAVDKLTKSNLRFVLSVAKQYQYQGLSLSDLVNEGNIGLIKAINHYDETRGFKFISYAVRYIRQSILSALASSSKVIRLPTNKIAIKNKILKFQNSFFVSECRYPTFYEISDATGFSYKDISAVLGTDVTSLNEVDHSRDGEELIQKIEDLESHNPESNLLRDSFEYEIEIALKKLTKKEEDILRRYFGIGCDPQTLDEIAMYYKQSSEGVRVIKLKALHKLKYLGNGRFLKKYM